jgi:diaminohydroxyphosphoribosylaminopyrimidine deaminase / 5-amino-6-(5-phosphoribosylamino)uracil reductase
LSLSHEQAMLLAIEEGQKGWGFVSPNPAVGCVILDSSNNLLSKGYHKKFGGPHAEINALNAIKNKSLLKEATVYVTLEPCAHEGKTPSCALELVNYPIKKIIYGITDPNPLVAGKGHEILSKSNIQTHCFSDLSNSDSVNVLLEELCETFLYNINQKKAFIALKVATSLDGKIALENGESQWITNEHSRYYVHFLRGKYDAIIVGRGTLEKDNPKLNIRHEKYANKDIKIVILDPQGRSVNFLPQSNINKLHNKNNIFIICDKKISSTDFNTIYCPMEGSSFNLAALQKILYENHIYSAFVEGGNFVYSEFLKQKTFNTLYHFTAPKILGAGLGWSDLLKLKSLDQSILLKKQSQMEFKEDSLSTYVLNL